MTMTPADRSNSPPIISMPDADRDDPDRGGLVEHREEGLRRPERRRDDQEEDEDDDRRDQRADLGAGQQPVGQAELTRGSDGSGRAPSELWLAHDDSCGACTS